MTPVAAERYRKYHRQKGAIWRDNNRDELRSRWREDMRKRRATEEWQKWKLAYDERTKEAQAEYRRLAYLRNYEKETADERKRYERDSQALDAAVSMGLIKKPQKKLGRHGGVLLARVARKALDELNWIQQGE